MLRKIIKIDRENCSGCGLCASACHEGAIAIVEGKAQLLREDYCDGLGDCLPACPENAITFETREAAPYDEAAVKIHKASAKAADGGKSEKTPASGAGCSSLRQWPVQIKLAPLSAPYYAGCALLLAADCTAYAYGNFHRDFMENKVTLIGCPKLDQIDYSEKLGEILRQNDIRRVHVARMVVPCCGGMVIAARKAIQVSGKAIPLDVTVIAPDGTIAADIKDEN